MGRPHATLSDVAKLLDKSRGDALTMQAANGYLYVIFRRGKRKLVVRGFPTCIEDALAEMVSRIEKLNAEAA